jgi:hypothetical protein
MGVKRVTISIRGIGFEYMVLADDYGVFCKQRGARCYKRLYPSDSHYDAIMSQLAYNKKNNQKEAADETEEQKPVSVP